VASSAACFGGSGAVSCFYPEDEISCSVLDVPWAVAFPASFSRKIQLYQRKKRIYLTKASNPHGSKNK